MDQTNKTLGILAASLTGLAGSAQAGICNNAAEFSNFYSSVEKRVEGQSCYNGLVPDARYKHWRDSFAAIAEAARTSCPDLPWERIDAVANRLASSDMCIEYDGTKDQHYYMGVYGRVLGSAGKAAAEKCRGTRRASLSRCIEEVVCEENGAYLCDCPETTAKCWWRSKR